MPIILLFAACAVAPAHACGVAQWQQQIAEASRRYAIPEVWVRAVMRAESAGCTHFDGQPIVSHAGAMGLMQLMPATWAELRQRNGFGDDPHDPRENILAGAAYLREMYDRFGVPGAFAAYHAGPGRYDAHLRRAAPLPAETWRYLERVSEEAGVAVPLPVDTQDGESNDPIFAVARHHRSKIPQHDARLFVPLRHAAVAEALPDR